VLYPIPLWVSLLVERLASPLMTLMTREDDPDASPPQIVPDLAAVVALVGYHPLWTQFGPSTSSSLDSSLPHQRFEGALLVPLPGRQDERHRFAPTFRSQFAGPLSFQETAMLGTPH
jgi:hypothetical protein